MVTIFKDVPITGIKPVACRVGGPRGIVKAFLISAAGNVVIVDAGYDDEDGDRIVAALEGIGHTLPQVDLCLLTHNHGDHIGGLGRLKRLRPDLRVAVHRLDAQVVRDKVGCAVDLELQGGETLPLCGGLDVLHLPGHSPGMVGVYFRQGRSLFAGDVVFSAGEHVMPSPAFLSSDPEQAVRSANSLAEGGLEIDNLFVAHGDDVYGDVMRCLKRMSSPRRSF